MSTANKMNSKRARKEKEMKWREAKSEKEQCMDRGSKSYGTKKEEEEEEEGHIG